MINNKLLDWKYYFNKLPLYLQNCECFPEHFKIWWEFLTNVDNSSDTLLNLLDIYNPNYLQENENCDEFLDFLGNLYGVHRNLNANGHYLTLNNEEFLLLIKAQIIKSFNNGTLKQAKEFYESAGFNIFILSDTPATIRVYLLDANLSENLKDLFLSGLLTINNLGITQTLILASTILNYLVLDTDNWDEKNWG